MPDLVELQTVAIIPGFAEGAWHTSKLQKSLEQIGYTFVSQSQDADIIVAHSAGCFYIPERTPGQLLILVGPPYWPGKSGGTATMEKFRGDIRAAWQSHTVWFLVRKTGWNLFYALRDIARTRHIIKTAPEHNFHTALSGHAVAVIRNDNDAYLTPKLTETLPDEEYFNFYHLPGGHDDVWQYPELHAATIDEIIRDFATIQRS